MATRNKMTAADYNNANVINAIRHANNRLEAETPAPDGTLETLHKIGDVIIEGGYREHFTGMITRIAQAHVTSRMFREYYGQFLKGDIDHGGMVVENFLNVTKARDFAPAKANRREFERIRPDIDSQIHKVNWEAQYAATISTKDIRKAFTSAEGVTDLIDRIVGDLSSANNLDNKLLVEYAIKRAVLNGLTKPVVIDPDDENDYAIKQRKTVSLMSQPNKDFNSAGVYNYSPADDIYFVLDAETWARQDVEILANRFNMDRAQFLAHLIVIPSWTEFDFDRFDVVNEAHRQLEPFTPAEVAKLGEVKGVAFDTEAMQFYNVDNEMTDAFAASGLHHNYFLTVSRVYGISRFSNFVSFVTPEFEHAADAPITATVDSVQNTEQTTAVSLVFNTPLVGDSPKLLQTGEAADGYALVLDTGAVVFSSLPGATESVTLEAESSGRRYVAGAPLTTSAAVGETFTFTPEGVEPSNP